MIRVICDHGTSCKKLNCSFIHTISDIIRFIKDLPTDEWETSFNVYYDKWKKEIPGLDSVGRELKRELSLHLPLYFAEQVYDSAKTKKALKQLPDKIDIQHCPRYRCVIYDEVHSIFNQTDMYLPKDIRNIILSMCFPLDFSPEETRLQKDLSSVYSYENIVNDSFCSLCFRTKVDIEIKKHTEQMHVKQLVCRDCLILYGITTHKCSRENCMECKVVKRLHLSPSE